MRITRGVRRSTSTSRRSARICAFTVRWPANGAASALSAGLGGSSVVSASATPAGRARAVPASASAVVVVGLMITSLTARTAARAPVRFRFRDGGRWRSLRDVGQAHESLRKQPSRGRTLAMPAERPFANARKSCAHLASERMQVVLPDGTAKDLPDGASGADLAASIGAGLARAALAVKVDGEVRDLTRPLQDGAPGRDRHEPRPRVARADPPRHRARARGRDPRPLPRHEDLDRPADRRRLLLRLRVPRGRDRLRRTTSSASRPRCASTSRPTSASTREDVTVEQALERFRGEEQDYKVELIEDLVANNGAESVSLYTNGPFTDLCRGPHAPSTKRIKAFKLLSVAGAYWRGDSDRQMLTRIYGTAFHTKEELEQHLSGSRRPARATTASSAASSTCSCSRELSPGSPFWQPQRHGALERAERRCGAQRTAQRGYREVKTPILYDVELCKTSGHWHEYRENMYFTDVEERAMGIKPMNCPAHVQLFYDERRSYRDLPIRYSEAGLVHRHEPSGTLHGLLRVRHITQDDAHIFCTEEQIEEEVDPLPGLRLRDLRPLRLRAPPGALDPAGEADRRRGDVGPRRGGAAARARVTAGSSTTSTRATAPSTAPRSTST